MTPVQYPARTSECLFRCFLAQARGMADENIELLGAPGLYAARCIAFSIHNQARGHTQHTTNYQDQPPCKVVYWFFPHRMTPKPTRRVLVGSNNGCRVKGLRVTLTLGHHSPHCRSSPLLFHSMGTTRRQRKLRSSSSSVTPASQHF